MKKQSCILSFYKQLFLMSHCSLLEETATTITVQLTKEMDQAIMNRPFYWTYMQTIGQEGRPQKATFSIKEEEAIHTNVQKLQYDNPLYIRTLDWLQEKTIFGKYYEAILPKEETMLYPWLLLNIELRYEGEIHTSEVISVGLQLIHGVISFEMMELLEEKHLTNKINDYCYTITPIISMKNGYHRIIQAVDQYLETKSYDWAIQSNKKLKRYEACLQENIDSFTDNELNSMYDRLQPLVRLQIINSAIIYLQG